MALRFDNKIFYHIPKTGGTYVRAVIKSLTDDWEQLGNTHATPYDVPKGNFSFAVVRDPVDWYRSYFRYRLSGRRGGWNLDCMFDRMCAAPVFEEFILRVINTTVAGTTGYVGMIYIPFLRVDRILRFEQLDEDLAELFKHYDFKPLKRIKVSSRLTIDTSLSEKTLEKLREYEAAIISCLGY